MNENINKKIAEAERMVFNRKPSITSDYQQGAFFGYGLAEQEINRLKGLLVKAYNSGFNDFPFDDCNKFKKENNLQ